MLISVLFRDVRVRSRMVSTGLKAGECTLLVQFLIVLSIIDVGGA